MLHGAASKHTSREASWKPWAKCNKRTRDLAERKYRTGRELNRAERRALGIKKGVD